MNIFLSKYWLFPLVCFLSLNLRAEVARFQHISIDDGLPDNSIRAIGQDANGFMWFGTELGLSKFDGHQLKNYIANQDEKKSLADSYIRGITIGPDKELWIGGEGGLNRYNKNQDNFTVFKHDEKNENSLSSDNVMNALFDGKEILWVATDFGLNRINLSTHNITHFFHSSQDENTIPHNKVRTLMRSLDGTLWIGGNKGLSYFDEKTQAIFRVSITDNEQPTILTLSESKAGTIWLGTIGGLYKFDPVTRTAIKIEIKNGISYVLTSLIDSDDNLWIGTYFHGLFRISPNGETLNITKDKSVANSLSDNTILSLYQDFSGVIWVGTYNAGIDYFDPKSLLFGTYDNSVNSINCMDTSDIRSAQFINNNEVLLGSLSGLIKVDLLTNRCTVFSSDENNPDTISHNEVYAIIKDTENQFWIGTADGFDHFNATTGLFERFGKQIDNVSVHKILNFESYLIVGSNDGLYYFDKKTKKLSSIGKIEETFRKAKIHNLVKAKNGKIYAASQDGLLEIDSKFEHVKLVSDKYGSLMTGIVLSLTIDMNESLYFTIEGKGLFQLDLNTNRVSNISERLHLKSKEGTVGLLTDNLNNVWLSTLNKGLFQLNKSRNILKNYGVSSGLHSELFNFGSFAKAPDGRLLFGGKSGFNLFDPKKIETNQAPPIVSLAQLRRFGKIVRPHQDYDGFKIDQNISELNELNLSHRDSVFGFDFVATHYLAPEKTIYTYKLDGFDSDWTTTNAQNRGVTYNNIDPGEYTFRVKAQTKNGVWSENNVALKVIVSPAPWLTWWAYTIYLVCIISSVLIFIRKRTEILEARALHLQKTVNERTQELVEEKNKVEQLLSRKNEEFANVSHEFRTPLTLVLGPLAQVLKTNKNTEELGRLNIIQRNGYRLLRMVDQLLNMETFRIKSITQKAPQAIGRSISLLTEAFADLAKEKNIRLTLKKAIHINFEFTPDALEKILLNLLSNAIKYTKAGGVIQVSAFRTKNNELCLCVKDTGIGIPADKQQSIFDRYSRVLDENSEQVAGAGIGLALVKELVEAHQGRIEVTSHLGEGTTLTIYLPIIGEVSDDQVNLHSNDEIVAMELMSLTSQTASTTTELNETFNEHSDKPSVLVIEDNADMRSYITSSISDDYQVLTARDGEEGIALAIEHIPDLIISDIMMPKKDGYQTAYELRNNNATNHIPIILLTARGDRESRLKGWYEKADEYLTKPFDVEELKIRLNNLLEIRDILRKRFGETAFEPANLASQLLASTQGSEIADDDVESHKNQMQFQFIQQLNQILEERYTDSSVTIGEIAGVFAMSERQFFRKVKNIVDIAPSNYLRRYRLEKAKEFLKQGKNTTYTGFEVGFSSQSYFSKCFKAQFGVSPNDYRKNLD